MSRVSYVQFVTDRLNLEPNPHHKSNRPFRGSSPLGRQAGARHTHTNFNNNNDNDNSDRDAGRGRFSQTVKSSKVIPRQDVLKQRLTPVQYRVTQDKATEREYSGEYCRFSRKGTYACIVCGKELFSSQHKYFSGSGWPSFRDTIASNGLRLRSEGAVCGATCSGAPQMVLPVGGRAPTSRSEVSCKNCGAHLGHKFDDGPKPTGVRYCVNSASLNFVPSPTTSARKPKETAV